MFVLLLFVFVFGGVATSLPAQTRGIVTIRLETESTQDLPILVDIGADERATDCRDSILEEWNPILDLPAGLLPPTMFYPFVSYTCNEELIWTRRAISAYQKDSTEFQRTYRLEVLKGRGRELRMRWNIDTSAKVKKITVVDAFDRPVLNSDVNPTGGTWQMVAGNLVRLFITITFGDKQTSVDEESDQREAVRVSEAGIEINKKNPFSYAVYDLFGKEIMAGTSQNTMVIPMPQVQTGVYFVAITSGGKKTIHKILYNP